MPIFTFANDDPRTEVRDKLIAKLSPVIDVKADFEAVGDGSTDDTTAIQNALDAAYGTTGSPHGTAGIFTNHPVYFPPGNYKVTSPLTMRSVRGAHLFGAGRFVTKVHNTAGGNVFTTNGFEYSMVEGMLLQTSSTGVCFDLDWDNTGPTALQSNTFRDMYFEGGSHGLRIGVTGFMGSETLIQNCFFANHTTAGINTANGNALQQTMIGGNIAGCAIGILVSNGSVPIIHGVGFQNQTTYDIQTNNSAGDTYSIQGCRTESLNFVKLQNGSMGHISACLQTNASDGSFAFIEGNPGGTAGTGCLSISASYSINGKLTGNGTLYITGNPSGNRCFGNASYISGFSGTVAQNI